MITKTINPLPFLSLEPKRFEDLIRSLVYDLKIWRQLEATGRLGNDSGFDIRGWEIVSLEEQEIEPEEVEDQEERTPSYTKDRLWLIQGKREKTITPKKMQGYLDDIFQENRGKLYGVIFVAACDFSKDTRDLFRARMIKEKVQEFSLWSGAELEDMLYQPKNDNLLFAFFGVSLQIRKKTIISKIKSKISIKAKAIKVFGSLERPSYQQLLIRNPEDDQYPYKDIIKDFDKNPRWIPAIFHRHYHSGIIVKFREYHAYIGTDRKHWDYTNKVNEVYLYQDPWVTWEERMKKSEPVQEFIKNIPEENRALLDVYGYIPYEKILAIDPDGDAICPIPQIFVLLEFDHSPFTNAYAELYVHTGREFNPREVLMTNPDDKDRIKFFPKKFPKPKKHPKEDLVKEVTVPDPIVSEEEKSFPDLKQQEEKEP